MERLLHQVINSDTLALTRTRQKKKNGFIILTYINWQAGHSVPLRKGIIIFVNEAMN